MPLPLPPPRRPKHTEEQLKLAASGLQLLALAVIGGVLLAPQLNDNLHVKPLGYLLAFCGITLAEGVAFILLRYIPIPEDGAPSVPDPAARVVPAAEEDEA